MSTGAARAQAIVAAQNPGGLPSRLAFLSSPGTVLTVGGSEFCVKSTGVGGGCFKTLNEFGVCGLLESDYTVQDAQGFFPGPM